MSFIDYQKFSSEFASTNILSGASQFYSEITPNVRVYGVPENYFDVVNTDYYVPKET